MYDFVLILISCHVHIFSSTYIHLYRKLFDALKIIYFVIIDEQPKQVPDLGHSLPTHPGFLVLS
jgi:hypothetical protein